MPDNAASSSQAMQTSLQRDPSAWERHGQTVIAGVILAAILWAGKSLTELTRTTDAVLSRVTNLESRISTIDERFDKYQTKSQAAAERETQALRDQLIYTRIDAVESKQSGKGG